MRNGVIKGNLTRTVFVSSVLVILLLFWFPITIRAVDTVPTDEDTYLEEQRKSIPIDTNSIAGWPEGPINGAESCILIEEETGTILYSKNMDEKLYPASITKIMTALLTVENCNMDDVITFADEAINNTELSSSRIGIMPGEQLTVEQALYGLLLGSANEVAYGLALHVGGTLENFVQMMNDKAAELGCENTHFANASGLPNEEHYVTAHDMARIAQAFFANDTLCMISGSYSYVIPATNKTNETRPLENHHKMITGKKYEYDGIVGGKTGYTNDARQTLVTCAQRDGMKLICVVLKDESPNQFLDTAALLDYGFAGFSKKSIASLENRYNIDGATFFHTNLDIMGSSKSILTINKNGMIVLPKSMDFFDADVKVEYVENDPNIIAYLRYYVGNNQVGFTSIEYADSQQQTFEFANIISDHKENEPTVVTPEKKSVFISVKKVLIYVLIFVGGLLFIFIAWALIVRYIESVKRSRKKKRKRYKSRSENSRRRNYKKRSENRKRFGQSAVNGGGNLYTKPIYQELSQYTAESAYSDNDMMSNRSDSSDSYYPDDEQGLKLWE